MGFFTSFVFGLWLLIGSLRNPYPLKSLPLSIEECPVNSYNETMTTMVTMVTEVAMNVTEIPMSNMER